MNDLKKIHDRLLFFGHFSSPASFILIVSFRGLPIKSNSYLKLVFFRTNHSVTKALELLKKCSDIINVSKF